MKTPRQTNTTNFLGTVLSAGFENLERGCVVLDQPQHAPNFRPVGTFSDGSAGLRHSRASFFKHALRRAMSRRRRLACVVLALLPLFSLTALGDQEGDFVYQTDGGAAVVTAYVGPGGDVVIPAQLGGLSVTTIGALNWA